MTNAAGQTSTHTVTLKLVEPVAPSFASDPTAFTVFAGYDHTYTFPAITDGSETPSSLSVSIDTISSDEYTFNPILKTIEILGSNNNVFDGLAGTTLTLTATLSHAHANRQYTQTISIASYQKPVLSDENLTDPLEIYNGIPFEFTYPAVTYSGYDLIATLEFSK